MNCSVASVDVFLKSIFVSTLPSRLVTRYRDTLDVFDLPFDARGFSMFAAWHPRSQLDPASVWLRETLADVAEHWTA